MSAKISDDVRTLLDFELEQENEVLNFGGSEGYAVVELRYPFHVDQPKFREILPETLHAWQWGSQHYEEKYEGFRSTLFPYDAIVVRTRERVMT